MARGVETELDGWDEIIREVSSIHSPEASKKAQATMIRKLVLSIVNLQETIKSHQAKTTSSLDKLTASIDKFNENSGQLAKAGLWLSGAIAFATIAQVIIAIVKK